MVDKPIRIQRRRAKGWQMPPNTVYVGRPSRWGNPFEIGLIACGCRSAGECSHNSFRRETPDEAVASFRSIARSPQRIEQIKQALRGKNLACWCPLDQPCHADVLLEIANG